MEQKKRVFFIRGKATIENLKTLSKNVLKMSLRHWEAALRSIFAQNWTTAQKVEWWTVDIPATITEKK